MSTFLCFGDVSTTLLSMHFLAQNLQVLAAVQSAECDRFDVIHFTASLSSLPVDGFEISRHTTLACLSADLGSPAGRIGTNFFWILGLPTTPNYTAFARIGFRPRSYFIDVLLRIRCASTPLRLECSLMDFFVVRLSICTSLESRTFETATVDGRTLGNVPVLARLAGVVPLQASRLRLRTGDDRPSQIRHRPAAHQTVFGG